MSPSVASELKCIVISRILTVVPMEARWYILREFVKTSSTYHLPGTPVYDHNLAITTRTQVHEYTDCLCCIHTFRDFRLTTGQQSERPARRTPDAHGRDVRP